MVFKALIMLFLVSRRRALGKGEVIPECTPGPAGKLGFLNMSEELCAHSQPNPKCSPLELEMQYKPTWHHQPLPAEGAPRWRMHRLSFSPWVLWPPPAGVKA